MSHNKNEKVSFFPKESLKQEVVDILLSANIGDGGYESTGDVALESTSVKNSSIQVSQEEREEFLKKCGINPKEFLGS